MYPTLFDNVVTKSEYLPVYSDGKISLERKSRCFAQCMAAYRRLALWGGGSHSYMGRFIMHYCICLAHCRDYRLDNGQEKVTCWYKKQSCPVSDRQILDEATHTRFWGQAVRLSLISIFIIAKQKYSSSRFYFYNLQSFEVMASAFFCADAHRRGFRVLRFSMFLNVFMFSGVWCVCFFIIFIFKLLFFCIYFKKSYTLCTLYWLSEKMVHPKVHKDAQGCTFIHQSHQVLFRAGHNNIPDGLAFSE